MTHQAKTRLSLVALPFLLYAVAAWTTFQWRNPKANQMSFWRDLPAVMTWKTLPQYQ